MALVLTEEQSMLRDSARGLIGDKAPVAHLRKLRDDKDATGFSRELWKTFAEMGFAGLLVPEAIRRQRARLRRGRRGDGGDRPQPDAVAVSRRPPCSPPRRCRAAAATRRSQQYLPKIADGSLLAALAIDEGAKHRPLQHAAAGGALRQRLQAQRRQGASWSTAMSPIS